MTRHGRNLHQRKEELIDRWKQVSPQHRSSLILEWINLKEELEAEENRSRARSGRPE